MTHVGPSSITSTTLPYSNAASPFYFPLTDASSASSSPPSLLFSPAPSAATSQLTGTSSVTCSSCDSPPATHPTIYATQQHSKREQPISDAGQEPQKAHRPKRTRRSEAVTCGGCGKEVKTASYARHCRYSCIGRQKVRCHGCQKDFSRSDSLKRHQKACHGLVQQEEMRERLESFNFKFPPPLPLLSQPPPTFSLPAGPAPVPLPSGFYTQTAVAEHLPPSTSTGAGPAQSDVFRRDKAQCQAQMYKLNQQMTYFRDNAQIQAQLYELNQQLANFPPPGPPPGHVHNDFNLPQVTNFAQLPGSHGQADIPTTVNTQPEAPTDTTPARSESDLYFEGSFGILPDEDEIADQMRRESQTGQFTTGATEDFWSSFNAILASDV